MILIEIAIKRNKKENTWERSYQEKSKLKEDTWLVNIRAV